MTKTNTTSRKVTPTKKGSTTKKHKIPLAQKKILDVAAAHKLTTGEDLEQGQVSTMTGITGGSTIRNAISGLKKKKLLRVSPDKKLIPTEEGFENAVVEDVEVPTSNKEHHEKLKKHFKLSKKAIQVFNLLVDGKTYEKQEVADKFFKGKQNSTFRNALAELRKAKMMETNGSIRLTDEMFPFVPRPEN